MKRYIMGPISFGSATPTILWQTQNIRVNPGIERLVQAANTTDVVFAGLVKQVPALTFDTPAIARMLGVIGFGGANIDQVDIYFRQMDHGGTIVAGANHVKVSLLDTLGLLRRITASQWQEASASFEIQAAYDGTNIPIAVTTGQSLPAYDNSVIEKFTVGPAELNSTDLDNIQSFDLDTGITVETDGQDGGPYARLAAIKERQPVITLTTFDAEALSTVGVNGASKDNAIAWLRGLTNKGAPAADTASSHIKFTAADSHVIISDMGDTTTINIQPVWDGSNDMLAIATGQAIEAL